MNTESKQFHLQVFSACETLPLNLLQWLKTHQAHPIFTSPEWFIQLANFKKNNERNADTEYSWLVLFSFDKICVAAPLERKNNKFKIISNFYSPYTEIYYDQAILTLENAWSLLLTYIDDIYKNWLSIEVTPLYPKQAITLKSLQATTPVSVLIYNFSANFSSEFRTFEHYWSNRPSFLRNTHKRKLKALSGQFKIEIHSKLTDEVKKDYWQIYAQSWKLPEPSKEFINWLMQWADANNRLRLGILKINDQAAAFQLWLLESDTAYIFKLAQDKSKDNFSPGTILMEHMIRNLALQDKICRIDFLLGTDNFKNIWMEEHVEVTGAEIINKTTISGFLLISLYKLRDLIKCIKKTMSLRNFKN